MAKKVAKKKVAKKKATKKKVAKKKTAAKKKQWVCPVCGKKMDRRAKHKYPAKGDQMHLRGRMCPGFSGLNAAANAK